MFSSVLVNILMIILLVACLFLVRQYLRNRQKERAERVLRTRKRSGRNHLYYFYVLFTTVPGIRSCFEKTRSRLRGIYPADELAINNRATKIILKGIGISIAIITVTMFVAKGDFFFIFAGIFMTYIMFITIIDRGIDKVEEKLIDQLRLFIDAVREQYNRLQRVDDAVEYTMDRLPYEIGLHAQIIHDVLTSTDIEEEANRYVDVAPNKFFITFTAIAATTMEYGDKKIDNGQSLFLKNLNFLKEEVNMELLKRRKNANLFSGLTFVTLIPVFAIKPIEVWAMTNMPNIADYYKGSYGIIAMAVVFLLSGMGYTIVRALKNGRSDEGKESSFFRWIADIPAVRKLINGQVSKNYSKALRYNEMLHFTGNRLGVNTFLVKRWLCALATLIIVAAITISSITREKHHNLHEFDQAFDTSIIHDEKERTYYQKIAEDYTNRLVNAHVNVMENGFKIRLEDSIRNNTEIAKEDRATMVANVVCERVKKNDSIIFHWYYMLVILGSGFIGYMIPLWILIFRQKAVRMNMEDEVSQFQTIIQMLIHVDGANTIMILEWMERFAYCFKEPIAECIIDLPHDGQDALLKMQDCETFGPFQSLVNCMLSIDSVGIEKAFANIETDREYYKEKRKEDNEILMNRKATIGKWVSLVPLAVVFGAYLILPMVMMATTMMTQINEAAA